MPQIKSVTVEITCSDSTTPPAAALVRLSLADVSLADAPSTPVTELALRWGSGFPITLPLPFDWSQINQKHEYAIGARIENDGQLVYINTTNYTLKPGVGTYQVEVEKVHSVTEGLHGGNLMG
ncbi:YbaY family lipoprotein [Pseudomonas sp. NPDC089758]|uniref:YbaY family lipoprotein n=1 Tax=Pseudomonas sp. NPDC089758 TaxID=3364473 RepID=UPI00382BBB62